jgi:hypothetical protein
MEPPTKAISCNCSICSRAGWLLTVVPQASFNLLAGSEMLTDYQFGQKKSHHPFCKVCGVRSFSSGTMDGKATVAVNLRCIPVIDVGALPVEMVDGATR